MNKQRILFLLLSAVFIVGVADRDALPAAGSAELEAQPKFVALTFDDGPVARTTRRLLDGLRERGASATFFLVGNQIGVNEDLVIRMKAEGHQVGNHTWDHTKLQGADSAVVLEQVSRTDQKIRELLGDGDYWVRPPYGLVNENQRALFKTPLVRWSVDPEDWKRQNVAGDVQAVLSKVQPGDIILMHDSYAPSVDAALQIVDALQSKGYEFVTVKELLALNGIEPQPGVIYRSGRKT